MTTFKELNRKNNELHHRLNDENMEIMTDMVVYLRSRLSDFQVELIRQDLLDMALSAQDRHVPLSEVFGEDYKKFCDEIIENGKRRDGLWTALDWIRYMSLGVAMLALYDCVLTKRVLDLWRFVASGAHVVPAYPITAGFVFSTLAIMAAAHALVFAIARHAFETHRLLTLSRPRRFAIGAALATLFCAFVLATYVLSKVVLVRISMYAYLCALASLFVLYGLLSLVLKRRRVPIAGSW
ncbi:hypothetical protein [Alicyclobacillus kakegawensis]|uniref:hypothetical protein n=1 Tax=Alicyclobacillus kakegawensis TaxID=392012 RepID=UPI000833AECB|nr:hypothetical protein [Alicyclobacillus kakegawensis]